MVQDPEFIAAAEKRGAELDPTSGAEVQAFVKPIFDAPKEIVEIAKKAID
jgi:hypothetical protein